MTVHQFPARRLRLRRASLLVATVLIGAVATAGPAAAGPAAAGPAAAGPAAAVAARNADLSVRLAAPHAPVAGTSFTMTVRVTDRGPNAATDVSVAVEVGPALIVTAAPGGRITGDGRQAGFLVTRIGVGATATVTVTVQVPAGTTARQTLVARARSLSVPDPSDGDNAAQTSLRPAPAG